MHASAQCTKRERDECEMKRYVYEKSTARIMERKGWRDRQDEQLLGKWKTNMSQRVMKRFPRLYSACCHFEWATVNWYFNGLSRLMNAFDIVCGFLLNKQFTLPSVFGFEINKPNTHIKLIQMEIDKIIIIKWKRILLLRHNSFRRKTAQKWAPFIYK